MQSIDWVRNWTPEEINLWCEGTILDTLGIVVTEVGDEQIVGKMPVDHRTRQPEGILHGGASAVLAESLASIASTLLTEEGHYTVGIELNLSHLKAVRHGEVVGICKPIRLGRTLQVWEVKIFDEMKDQTCEARVTVFRK